MTEFRSELAGDVGMRAPTPTEARRRVLEGFAARAREGARRPGLDAAAAEAFDALEAAGVDALLLKGPALARRLYRPGELRTYYDVDLLASPGDLTAVGSVLSALGYMNISESDGVVDVAGVLHAQVWSRWDPGVGTVTIDLHWRLAGCQAPPATVWTAIRRQRSAIDLGVRKVPTLAAPALALHVALHAAQHGPSDLKAMDDLERGLARWPAETWPQAAALAREVQATEAFAAGMRLLAAGVALADQLGLPPAEVELWMISHRSQRPRGVFHLEALAKATNVRARIGVVRHALLPTCAWIAGTYPWAAGGRCRLLAGYALHVLRSPVWAVRAWRFSRRAPR